MDALVSWRIRFLCNSGNSGQRDTAVKDRMAPTRWLLGLMNWIRAHVMIELGSTGYGGE